ncbi:branched-chain-amino-acid aminotransferase-like protein 2 [Acanthaster planci]|uniref:Branched-chain-amino-acid aminotransferase-like protein 2 n=1 Tax=Acanthaster planci TaxID=133434 RepID=A0A8B7Y5W5_ACAPL|nr:branched-chain-amino-acid aminotransferase-like protein 2 [Acanthaster planci]XP_022087748.1 branched-chain-amino-acid aminotransferase-like protein 2 [Acanthaster planci]
MEEQGFFTSQSPVILDRVTADDSPPPQPPVRVMLWCVPRSVSTAFLKCIDGMDRPAEIFHEPYSVAYYFGPERRAPPGPPIPEERQYTYSWVRKQLEADYIGREVIFCKDMAFAVDGRYDAIPDGFKHTFLIRKPVKAFKSFHKVVNGYPGQTGEVSVKNGLPRSYAFKESYDLYNHICANYREKPIIVDADDLCRSPGSILKKYCAAVGLPFSESMLSWQPSDGISSRWHCAPSFRALNSTMGTYERALKSESFVSKDHNHNVEVISKDGLPKGVVECSEFSEPYYKKMYELRLKP